MQGSLISLHSSRLGQSTTVVLGSTLSQLSSEMRVRNVESNCWSQIPNLTLARRDARAGSEARLTSRSSSTDNCIHRVVPKTSLRLTAGSWAGTCLPPPPHGRLEERTCANLRERPSAVRTRKKSSIENSSITKTSVLRKWATWTVPFSSLELHSMSRANDGRTSDEVGSHPTGCQFGDYETA